MPTICIRPPQELSASIVRDVLIVANGCGRELSWGPIMAELFSETEEFHKVVRLLRALPAHFRVMALHAAIFWDDERLRRFNESLKDDDADDRQSPAPVLKLVPKGN